MAATPLSRPDGPLVTPGADGTWVTHEDQYTPAQIVQWQLDEWRACAEDPFRFITHWCYAVDLHSEDGGGSTVSLIPDWPHVRAIVAALFPPRDVLLEKSRQMLASWTLMACVLWDLIFAQNWTIMTLSRVETLVDDGGEKSTTQSLHGKARFMWEHLPSFLRPWRLEFKALHIINALRNVHVQGFSSSASPGRGGSYQRAILDEASQLERSEEVMSAVVPACPSGKVLASTPHGKGNAFARIRHQESRSVYPRVVDGEAGRHWERTTLHWSLHPRRSQAWKDAQVAAGAMTAEAVAQELEINYELSRGRRVYPKYVEDMHLAGGVLAADASCHYDPQRALYVTCDFNHDPLIWEIVQVHNTAPRFRVIGEICQRDAMVDDALNELVVRFRDRSRVQSLLARFADWRGRYDRKGVCQAGDGGHAGPLLVYGDATEEKSTVHNRVKTYQEIRAKLRDYGFTDVRLKVPPSNPPRERRFQVVNDALARGLVLVSPECEELRKDFEHAVWNTSQQDVDQATEDDDGSHLTRSHASSALGYLLCQLHTVGTTAEKQTGGRRWTPRELPQSFVRGWNRPTG